MSKTIAILAGDGIGPEVMEQAKAVLSVVERKTKQAFTMEAADVGGVAIDRHGVALPDTTVALCRKSDAILFGSVGGPQWETLPPEEQPERAALLPLRKIFGLFANLRPAIVFPQLADSSPLRPESLAGGLDIIVVRELTGGIYFGSPKGREEGDDPRAFDTLVYRKSEIERIARVAFATARARAHGNRGRVCSIDKANVLTSMVFWREVVSDVAADYPDVALTHMYVDNAAMQLVRQPKQFDVVVT
ncbi:MAG: 3-isopropylmalate dehydrogenase, partial [Spirochaetales bacterium]|nr:3-isopropylmalate dehydrogenase [Spirochaetales bacterium]